MLAIIIKHPDRSCQKHNKLTLYVGYHPEKFGQFSSSRELHETPIYWVIRHGEFHDQFSFFFQGHIRPEMDKILEKFVYLVDLSVGTARYTFSF